MKTVFQISKFVLAGGVALCSAASVQAQNYSASAFARYGIPVPTTNTVTPPVFGVPVTNTIVTAPPAVGNTFGGAFTTFGGAISTAPNYSWFSPPADTNNPALGKAYAPGSPDLFMALTGIVPPGMRSNTTAAAIAAATPSTPVIVQPRYPAPPPVIYQRSQAGAPYLATREIETGVVRDFPPGAVIRSSPTPAQPQVSPNRNLRLPPKPAPALPANPPRLR